MKTLPPRFRRSSIGASPIQTLTLVALASVLVQAGVRAAGPGELDPAFNAGLGVNGTVKSIARQADGKRVIGGEFSSVDNVPRWRVARLNADGSLDVSFDPGSSVSGEYTASVNAVAVQPDGKVVVGGDFIRMQGMPHAGVARLNPDGSLDASFNAYRLGEWESGYVAALALQPDGRIVAANYRYVFRLNPDGSLDTTFAVATTSWRAYALALQPDGRILLGGDFGGINGVARRCIARLQADGTLDPTFDPGVGPRGLYSWSSTFVWALAVQPDGAILAGGSFDTWSGTSRGSLARLTPGGDLDLNFDPGAGFTGGEYYSVRVRALAAQADGRVLAGGIFTAVDGTARTRVARLNADGSVDEAFNPVVSGSAVQCFDLPDDGGVVMGGSFDAVNGQPRRGLARVWSGLPPVILTQPRSLVALLGATARLTVTATGQQPLSYEWRKHGLPLAPPQTGPTLELLNVQAADAGSYTVTLSNAFGSVTSQAALLDVTTNMGPPVFTVHPASQTVVEGGNVTFRASAPGAPMSYQWRKDGSDLPGATQDALSLVHVRPDDAGNYWVVASNPGGSTVSMNASLTVLSPPAFAPPSTLVTVEPGASVTLNAGLRGSSPVSCQWRFHGTNLAGATQPTLTLPDAQTVNQGEYTLEAANAVGRAVSPAILLAVWQPGAVVPTFTADFRGYYNFGVTTLALQPDGKVLVGARQIQQQWGGPRSPAFALRRLNPDGSMDDGFLPNLGPAGAVRALALRPDGRMVIGGSFFGVNGVTRNGLARLHPDGTLDASFVPAPTHGFRFVPPTEQWGPHSMEGVFDVQALAVQDDGRILAGGTFGGPFDGQGSGLVRFNPDGSVDPTFRPALGQTAEARTSVQALAVQPDGKILVAGAFSNLGSPGLVRLNPDGSLDASFSVGAGPGKESADDPPASLHALVLQPDGKILAGGDFTRFDFEPRHGVVRLNPDGSLDESFEADTMLQVATLALQPDGRLLVGGTPDSGVAEHGCGIVRLNANGSQDLSFRPGEGVRGGESTVTALALQPDGGVLMGRDFSGSYSWIGDVVRLFGSLPPCMVAQPQSVDVRIGTPVSLSVQAVGSQPLGYQWHKDGSPLPGQTGPTLTFADPQVTDSGTYAVMVSNRFGVTPSANAFLWVTNRSRLSIGYQGLSLAVVEGGNVTFRAEIAGTLPFGIQWKHDNVPIPGATNASFTLRNAQRADAGEYGCTVTNSMNNLTGQRYTLAVLQPPRFTSVPGTQLVPLGAPARLEAQVAGDTPVTAQWWDFDASEPVPGATNNTYVAPAATAPSARKFTVVISNAVGLTVSPQVPVVSGRAGEPDPSFATGLPDWIGMMRLAPDGHIWLGHQAMYVLGVGYDHVARLNADGTPDQSFETYGEIAGYCDTCHGELLGAQHDCKVLVEDNSRSLTRFLVDGTRDRGFLPPLEILGEVVSCTPLADGKIIVVAFDDTPTVRRLCADGSIDPTFATARLDVGEYPTWEIQIHTAVQPDGKVLVHGPFIAVNGVSRSYLARLHADGTLDTGFNLVSGPDESLAVAVQPDGRILLGGGFAEFNNTSCFGLIRLNANGTLDESFTPSLPPEYAHYEIGSLSASGIAVQPDGRILVAGSALIRTAEGYEVFEGSGVVRLFSDGQLDLSFPPYQFGEVSDLILQPDGRVLLSGYYNSVVRLLGDFAPGIAAQPEISGPVVVGDTVILSVTAAGTPPFTYQWRFNGVNIPGATSASLTLANVQQTEAGAYSVVVANASGSVTSSVVALVVLDTPGPAPVITSFAPVAGPVGAEVTLAGANFGATPEANIVYFGAVRAVVVSASPDVLTVTVPTGAAYAPITVTVNGLTAYAPAPFVVTFPGSAGFDSSALGGRLDLAVGDGPCQVAIGDLDGDGKADLAVANGYENTLSVFRNVSTAGSLTAASFAAPFKLAAGPGQNSPYRVVAGDLDGDGKLDLVALSPGGNSVSVFRNRGTPGALSAGSFAARQDFPTGNLPHGLAVQDLDGDGKPDVVTANWSGGTLSVLRNTSAGGTLSFAGPVEFVTGPGAQDVALGDLDGDGKPDVAVANRTARTVSVFRNSSAPGSLTADSLAPRVDLPGLPDPIAIALGDLDGDGRLDLAVGSMLLPEGGLVTVFRNLAEPGSLTTNSFAPGVPFPAAGWVHNVALGDLDGDGRPEVALDSELASAVSVFRNLSSPGSFTSASLGARMDFATGWNAWGLALGDLDGDGRLDAVFGNAYDDTVTIYRNTAVPPALTLGEAVDAPHLVWTTGGAAPWVAQTELTHDGEDAAHNGEVPDGEQSWLETTVSLPTPARVSFWWKVACGAGEFGLAFYTNGVQAGPNIDGWVDWQLREVLLPAGAHTLRWTYHNAAVGDEGSFGWLDQVTFTPMPESPHPGEFDLSFQANAEGGLVLKVRQQPDGRFLIGGYFASVNGQAQARLARLRPDGGLDLDFHPDVQGSHVGAVMVQPDGRILLGGWFTAVDDVSRPGLARLQPDGSLDVTFTPDELPSAFVTSLGLQPDGKVLVAGWTLGAYSGWLARLNPDGSLDRMLLARVDNTIETLLVQPDGKVLVGGGFYTADGVVRNGLFRLNADGSPDAGFLQTSVIRVRHLALQTDGRILAAADGVVRLHPNGSRDPSFQVTGPPSEWVTGLAVQPDGKVIVAGLYAVDGIATSGLWRLHPDGSPDPTFEVGAGPDGGDFPVWDILVAQDGKVLLAGELHRYDGIPRDGIVRLHNDLVMTFVERQLPPFYAPGVALTVTLEAAPAPTVRNYAVEDQPPEGWNVSDISHGGVVDGATGKVKFGPFYDHAPRLLSYVVTPPAGETGVRFFQGVISGDGANLPISGANQLTDLGLHPADTAPADSSMSVAEVTAYGGAWRGGDPWPVGPNPIPIHYVSRAAALWRGGECYTFDPTAPGATLCWVNCDTGLAPARRALGVPPAPDGPDARATAFAGLSAAHGPLPPHYVPGEPVVVSITATPAAGVNAYAVEDQFPAAWTVDGISAGGALDTARHSVKWGPFYDAAPRVLAYMATPSVNPTGLAAFHGVASFAGADLLVTGNRLLREACQLTVVRPPASGPLQLTLSGRLGARFVVEVSSDLETWTVLATVTNTDGRLVINDPDSASHGLRFYRARLIE